jgi:hypothetical protein
VKNTLPPSRRGHGLYSHNNARTTLLNPRVLPYIEEEELSRVFGGHIWGRMLNPGPGVYDFSIIDEAVAKAVELDKGLVLQFHHTNSSPDAAGTFRTLPAWLVKKLGPAAAFTIKKAGASGSKELPNFAHPPMQEWLFELLSALGAHLATVEHITAVVMSEPYMGSQADMGRPISTEQREAAWDKIYAHLDSCFPRHVTGGMASWNYEMSPAGALRVYDNLLARGQSYGSPDIAGYGQGGQKGLRTPEHYALRSVWQNGETNPVVTFCQKPTINTPPRLMTTKAIVESLASYRAYACLWQPRFGAVPGKNGEQRNIQEITAEVGALGLNGLYYEGLPTAIRPFREAEPEPSIRARRVMNVTRPQFLSAEDLASISSAEAAKLKAQLSALSSRLEG